MQSYVREQVLYREALELGLDRNDTIVRRRMLQKMEFLGEAVAADDEPPASELERFFLAAAERYRVPAKATFTHVYFSRDRRGDRAVEDARAALPALRSPANADDPAHLGDPFLLGTVHGAQTRQSLDALFGASFTRAVFESEVGKWQGPVESAYGFHLVRVTERTEPRLPPLAEVRAQVLADWRDARRKDANWTSTPGSAVATRSRSTIKRSRKRRIESEKGESCPMAFPPSAQRQAAAATSG